MERERLELMAKERAFLEKEKELYPDLFPERTWVDDNTTLEALGIYIPGKERFPAGFLKLMPSDFIVEEITQDGRQTTVSREPLEYEDQEGDTVYATLVKCGLSTLEAVSELSKLLDIDPSRIQYAGIKDKDAITSQEISIRNVPKDKVSAVSSPHLFLKDIRTGKGVVTRGGLSGNRFTILMRIGASMHDDSHMQAALEALKKVKDEGFYNYFYLQRFGTPRLNNYKWGLSIMRGDYEKAVRGLISDPGLREIPYFLKKREEIIALAPDWEGVLERLVEFPLVFPSEIKTVGYLVNHPGDFAGALRQVEDQVMLWVSALASLLYNRKVSAYIMAGIEPPKRLPLFLSPDKNDWLPYSEDLEGVGIFPPDFNNLRPFRSMRLMHRDVETKDQADIRSAEVIDEGIVVDFTLGKGEYATTFLSHFVNLLSGKVGEDIEAGLVDTKGILKQDSISGTLEYFSEVNIPKH